MDAGQQKKVEALVNIASGVPVTMRQLMETVGRLMGRPELIQYCTAPYRAWEPMFFWGTTVGFGKKGNGNNATQRWRRDSRKRLNGGCSPGEKSLEAASDAKTD